jgi:hypothetical protein
MAGYVKEAFVLALLFISALFVEDSRTYLCTAYGENLRVKP